ncbi:MAG TPA: AMP-binding protein, partial [Streptosporangiaceae bacterium]
MREFTIPALAEIQASATLTDTVAARAGQAPDTVVLRRREGEGRWADVTAAAFWDEVRALAKGIMAAGIRSGDRVGLMSRTSYAWTLIDYAMWTAGAVTVPVYETSSADQVEWILSDSGCRAVFAETDAHAALITGVKGSLPDLENIWLIDAIATVTAGGAEVGDDELAARMSGRGADDLATIIYTSGTTGRPKG